MGQPLVVAELASLTSWNADWRGLRVGVLGLGVTGFAAADTLAELGADVLVVADSADDERNRSDGFMLVSSFDMKVRSS